MDPKFYIYYENDILEVMLEGRWNKVISSKDLHETIETVAKKAKVKGLIILNGSTGIRPISETLRDHMSKDTIESLQAIALVPLDIDDQSKDTVYSVMKRSIKHDQYTFSVFYDKEEAIEWINSIIQE